jgi:hypothetical protein
MRMQASDRLFAAPELKLVSQVRNNELLERLHMIRRVTQMSNDAFATKVQWLVILQASAALWGAIT